MPAIIFENEKKSLDVLPGTNLRKAALQSGVHLYSPFHRVFHLNVSAGPLRFPCGSDIVEIVDGKGVNARTDEEEAIVLGRWLKQRKVSPNHRLACCVEVKGDVTVRTLPKVDIDKEATKVRAGFIGVVLAFFLLMAGILGLIGLDLIKKL